LFEQSDFERLSAALQRLQGRFILSLNDVPEVRELFAWASIDTVELSYPAVGADHTKRVREVVISSLSGGAK
jgi:DNA adenine methylase